VRSTLPAPHVPLSYAVQKSDGGSMLTEKSKQLWINNMALSGLISQTIHEILWAEYTSRIVSKII